MDEETRKAFARVHLGICAIEGMVLQLLLANAIQTGDEASREAIRERSFQIKEVSEYFAEVIKRGEAE